jgi:hypothetical protein
MKAGPLGTSASIWALVVGAGLASSSIEQGLFLDFTSSAFQSSTGFYGSANVIDYTTPTNNYYSSPDKQASSFLTYTSPSPKIVMGPSGTLQYAPHNLILQSDNLATTWDTTGGSNSSTTFTEDTSTGSHQFRQIISVGNGFRHAVSIDLTPNGRNYFLVEVVSGATDEYSYIDLINGTILSGSGTTTITSQGNGKYRVRILFTSASTSATFFVFCQNGAGAGAGVSYTGNGVSGVIAGRAQCYRYPADSTYLATTTTDRYGLPFEWNTSGTLQGILDEPQSTNLILTSSVGSFSKVNVAATNVTGPDGISNSATRITTQASAVTLCYVGIAGAGNGTSLTYSIYAKKGSSNTEANAFGIYNTTTSVDVFLGSINYGTNVWTTSAGAGTAVVTSLNNGWIRIELTVTTNIAAGNNLNIYAGYTGGVFAAGQYADFYIPQLEAGMYASSPIQTAGSAVARAADNIKLAKTLFPINETTGTLFGQYSVSDPNTAGVIIWYAACLDDGTTNNTIGLYRYQSSFGAAIVTTGVTQSDAASVVATPTAIHKNAIAYTTNNAIQCVDGTLYPQDTSVTVPTITQLSLSRANANQVGKYIQKVSYWPVRKSNTALQTLTT